MIFKSAIIKVLTCSFFVAFGSSCISDNISEYYADWKVKNDSYLTNMKDSSGYVLYNIPASRGGSSFYYKITSPGDESGTSPLGTDYVTVNYRGKLITNYIFDETYTGNNPASDTTATPFTFYASGLIRGWTENLIQMKAGEVRRIVIPYELGYGAMGYGSILPYSTLVFDIQLKSFGPR